MSIFFLKLCNCHSFKITTRGFSHYDVLGVKPTATQKEIKVAFYEKSKQLHPDSAGSSRDEEEATRAFVQLKTAYDVLRRPADRRMYDLGERNKSYRSTSGTGSFYHANYQHYNYEGNWKTFYRSDPMSERMKDSDREKRSAEFWSLIKKWTAIGLVIVVIYNFGYAYQIHAEQRRISRLVDKDEIARSFLRQSEFRDKLDDAAEVSAFAQLLKEDVDAAHRKRDEELRGRNPNEIREEYRWMRAVTDVDHMRRIKARRAELRRDINEGRYFDSMVDKYGDPPQTRATSSGSGSVGEVPGHSDH